MILLLFLWLMSGRTFGEYMDTVSPFLIIYAGIMIVAFIICVVGVIKYIFKGKL